jgi:hypothetical protein
MRRPRPAVARAAVLAGALIVPVVAGVAGGCLVDNTLTGSIDQSHDLSFDRVELRLLTDQAVYELKYLQPLEAGGDDLVARVVVDQPAPFAPGTPIDLVAGNGRVDRVTAANDPFPELQAGTFTVAGGGVAQDEDTRGDFAATFTNGRTLNGTFRAPLVLLAFE